MVSKWQVPQCLSETYVCSQYRKEFTHYAQIRIRLLQIMEINNQRLSTYFNHCLVNGRNMTLFTSGSTFHRYVFLKLSKTFFTILIFNPINMIHSEMHGISCAHQNDPLMLHDQSLKLPCYKKLMHNLITDLVSKLSSLSLSVTILCFFSYCNKYIITVKMVACSVQNIMEELVLKTL